MGFLKKIVALVAIAALIYFAPGIGLAIAKGIGITSGFIGALIGATIIAAGTYLVTSILGGTARAPDIESGTVNVKINDPPRWLHCGRARSGGGALFGEFDADGRWWYIIVHSDEILHDGYSHFLDDEPVTLGPDHYVQQAAFRLKTNKDKDPADTDGEGRGYVRIWTTTYSETDPVPPGIAELTAALPQWTATEHMLAGTTYSVICMDALSVEHRYKIYRWRGPFGLGEPAVSVLGEWANAYDPRDPAQTLGDRTTYKPTRNAELVWAWFRTHPFGRGKSESSINWARVGEQATICDQIVTGIEGDQPRYEAGVAIVDSKRRVDAEKEVLLACDGQIVFDEDGKSWVRVGHWYTPTLSFSRNRDIMAMSSVEAQDGESETQGIIVRYIEPSANFTVQPSAAWINPLYYDPLTTPKFLTVDIQACQNHNQAMRLAKGIGMRSQPRHKIGPTVNLRGLQARQERIVTINYDNTFAGDYEIATPVELSADGIMTGFGAVPIEPNRWTLLPGEEQPKPITDGSEGAVTYPAITGETVSLADGAIRIDFPPIPRGDATYTAEYILTSEITGSETDPWAPMSINLTTAMSGLLLGSSDYTVRYRYVTASGRGPGWEYDTITTESSERLDAATEVEAEQTGTREVTLTWRAPRSPLFDTVAVVANGVEGLTLPPAGLGAPMSAVLSNVMPGPHTFIIRAFATDGSAPVDSDPVMIDVAPATFDFTGGTLDGATLTRASIGTRVDASGARVTEAADVPRFDHTAAGVLRGLLVEPERTNLLVQSQDLTSASWGKNGVTATTAARLVEAAAAGSHQATQAIAFTADKTYTFSCEGREAAGAKRWLALLFPANQFGGSAVYGKFDTAAGTVVASSGLSAEATSPAPGGGSRCRVTLLCATSGSGAVIVRLHNVGTAGVGNYTGDGTAALDTTSLQVEEGDRPSSYIPTTTTAATRAADVLTLPWGARGIPDGPLSVTVTFDDLTTQAVAMTVASGVAVLTTALDRPRVRSVAEA